MYRCMAQVNINTDANFERDLRRLMKTRNFRNKSEAIRAAVKEAAERASHTSEQPQFKSWLGLGTQTPQNPKPRFRSDADLWRDGSR